MTKTYEISYDLRERHSQETEARIKEIEEKNKGTCIMDYDDLKTHEAKTWLEQNGFNLGDLIAYDAQTSREIKRAKKGKYPCTRGKARKHRENAMSLSDYLLSRPDEELNETQKEIKQEGVQKCKEISTYDQPMVPVFDGAIGGVVRRALQCNIDGIVIYKKDSFDKKMTIEAGRFGHYILYNLKKSDKPVAVIEIKRSDME